MDGLQQCLSLTDSIRGSQVVVAQLTIAFTGTSFDMDKFPDRTTRPGVTNGDDFNHSTLLNCHFPLLIQSNQSSPSFTKFTWKLSKADWNAFYRKSDSELGQGYVLDLDDPVAHFTTILTSVAEATISKSKNRLVKHETVWFNKECKTAIRNRRKVLKTVKNQPADANMENYSIIRA